MQCLRSILSRQGWGESGPMSVALRGAAFAIQGGWRVRNPTWTMGTSGTSGRHGNIVCDVASLSISFHASGACLILDSFSFYQWEITINHPCPQTGSTALSGVQGTLIKGPNLRDTWDGKAKPGLPLKKCLVFHQKSRTVIWVDYKPLSKMCSPSSNSHKSHIFNASKIQRQPDWHLKPSSVSARRKGSALSGGDG